MVQVSKRLVFVFCSKFFFKNACNMMRFITGAPLILCRITIYYIRLYTTETNRMLKKKKYIFYFYSIHSIFTEIFRSAYIQYEILKMNIFKTKQQPREIQRVYSFVIV